MITSNSVIFVVKLLGKQKLTNVYIIVIIKKNKWIPFFFLLTAMLFIKCLVSYLSLITHLLSINLVQGYHKIATEIPKMQSVQIERTTQLLLFKQNKLKIQGQRNQKTWPGSAWLWGSFWNSSKGSSTSIFWGVT